MDNVKTASGEDAGEKTRRIIIWAVVCLAYLIVYFHRVYPAVIVDKLFALFHMEAAAMVGSLASVYFYIYFLMQIPAGIMVDVFGPRKVIAWGVTVSALGTFWFGLAGSGGELFASRFLSSLGVSVIFVSLLRLFTNWFKPREFGTVVGLTVFTGNLGAILAATPLAALMDWCGWQTTFLSVGVFSLLTAALVWLVVRNHPEDVLSAAPPGPAPQEPVSWTTVARTILAIVRDRHMWLALFAAFCIYGPFMALAGVWGVPYLMQVYGMGRSEAASYITMATVGVMLGAFIIGFVSDRMGSRKKPFLAFALGNALVWAALTWWNNGMLSAGSLLILFFLLGMFGNCAMLVTIILKEYNPPAHAGIATGLGNIGGFAGSAFMQPFFGYLLDLKWDGLAVEGVRFYSLQAYQFSFEACFFLGCLAVALISLLRESLRNF